MMKLTIGISPCPNDTYIFEAIFNQLIKLKDIAFSFVFDDVETLNEKAGRAELDIVKISYAHYFSLMDRYILLRSGGAMGYGTGPLLISKKLLQPHELKTCRIAIPGVHTTANFLLSFALPEATNKVPYRFDKIEEAVLNADADAGVIIHENRFTYAAKGLQKIMDLGMYWEAKTNLPIPLGGIAIRRSLPSLLQQRVGALIKQSIGLAHQRQQVVSDFIRANAQEMNEEVMKKHIALYVNEFSADIGKTGEAAVRKMKEVLNVQSELKIFI